MAHWGLLRVLEISGLLAILVTLSSAEPEMKCDVINDPDVKYFDIRLPETEVPDDLTTYVCQNQHIPLPMDQTYHAVAFEPILDHKKIMHHMILFGCPEAKEDEPHACGAADNNCRSFLVQWSMGIEGQICAYPDTGVRFGKGSMQSLALQIHWNNEKKVSGMEDSSGIRVYYTTKLRKYDVGNLQVGQNDLQIPPGLAHVEQSGSCSPECTRAWLREPIYLTRAHVHMHYVGDGGRLELYRDGERVQTVVEDLTYEYHSPPAHYLSPAVEVLPGDELRMTCYYNTLDGDKRRNHTLYWGEGSEGEMCYAFITYYPKIDYFDQCIQFDVHDICSVTGHDPVGDCVFQGFTRVFQDSLAGDIIKQCTDLSPITQGNADDADLKLDPKLLCSSDCAKAVTVVTEHPCMQGRLGTQSRRVFLPNVESWNQVKVILDAAARHCLD